MSGSGLDQDRIKQMKNENAEAYTWYTPRAMRQILEPVRGIPIPRPTLSYWRGVLDMRPSKDPLTKGLYSHDDLCILAGGDRLDSE